MVERILVGIGEHAISSDANSQLIASSLGSCLGIVIYDPIRKVAGMAHCLLPLSTSDPVKAKGNPMLYVDTGVPLLLNLFIETGSRKKDLVLVVAGGANINDKENVFEIGKKNYTVLRKILWKNELLIKAEDVGSDKSRTMIVEVGAGSVSVRTETQVKKLL